MKKVLMLATTAAMIEQFNKSNIKVLNDLGYVVDMAGNFHEGNPISKEVLDDFKLWIEMRGGKCYHISSVRNPLSLKKNCKAYRSLIKIIRENKYDFIHVHTPIGGVLGRVAAHQLHIPIIYTAHGFHFFKGAPLKNWLLYYPVEKFLSRWTDVLICINHEDYERARAKFFAKKTFYIPGVGIDVNKTKDIQFNRDEKRKELGLSAQDFIIVSVGELIPRKNHEAGIYALASIKEKLEDNNIHYIICGKGRWQDDLKKLAKNIKVEKHLHLLGYRKDIIEICKSSDVFLFMSHQEGLSVALMEAMVCGLPIICSKIRGNTDLIKDRFSGRILEKNPEEVGKTFLDMLKNPDVYKKYGENASIEIEKYSTENVNGLMKEIYRSILNRL